MIAVLTSNSSLAGRRYQDERKARRAPTNVDFGLARRSAGAAAGESFCGRRVLSPPTMVRKGSNGVCRLDRPRRRSESERLLASGRRATTWSEIDCGTHSTALGCVLAVAPGRQRTKRQLDAIGGERARGGEPAPTNERAERIRLLYVGATRARDYLVLRGSAF